MPKLFHIAGIDYTENQLKSKAEVTLASLSAQSFGSENDFLNHTWAFIKKWLDDSDQIEVSTSGSTGAPKIISAPKQWMKASASVTCKALSLRAGMSALLCISPAHIGGMMMIVRALEHGLHLHIQPPSRRPSVRDKIDFTAMVPLQVATLVDEPANLASFGSIIIGGAPLDIQTERRLKASSSPVYATYGMTETLSHIALRRLDGEYYQPQFKALSGVRLSVNADQLLHIQVEHMDGLEVQTTDRVELLNTDTFLWLGRADNVINSGGIKLHPELIEAELAMTLHTPFFIHKEAHDTYGETAVLCIEEATDMPAEIDAVINSITDSKSRPTKVYLISTFIWTENKKLKRAETFAQEKRRLT